MSKRKHNRNRREIVYDYILDVPLCDCCRKPIIGVEGFRDVRIKTSPSVYDRRHFNWICESCLSSVLRHSQLAS